MGGGPLTGTGDIYIAKFGDAAVSVAISLFDARAFEGGVALYGMFASNLRILRVNIYRTQDSGQLLFYESVPGTGEEFYYEDRAAEPGRTYRYQIGVVDQEGEILSQITTVRTQGHDTVLLQNSPKPFNPSTTIHFMLRNTAHVNLSIYNAEGRLIATLVDDVRGAGLHEARWKGTDVTGASVASGVYFYRMKVGTRALTKKMILLR